ncbi:MAG: hypothetical protein RL173_2351 [Fibrobacterota bacterium]|jgi:hypothetical protein
MMGRRCVSLVIVIALLFGCAGNGPDSPPPNIVLFKSDKTVAVLDPATRAQRQLFRIDSSLTLHTCFRLDDSTLQFVTRRTYSVRSDTESVRFDLFQVRLKSESVHRIAQANVRLHRYDTVLLDAEYFDDHEKRDSTLGFGVRIRECRAMEYLWQLPRFHPGLDEKIFSKGTNLFENRGTDTVQLTHSQDEYNPKCVNGYGLVAIHPDSDHIFATFRPSSNCFAPNMFSTRNILLRLIGEGPKLVLISKSTGRQKTVLRSEFGVGEFSHDGRYLLAPQLHPDGEGSESRFVYLDLNGGSPVAVDSATWAFWGTPTPARPRSAEH